VAIVIPYTPREVQRDIHQIMDDHRFVVLVAHRRMGKTVLAVNQLIKRSIIDGRDNGFYAYVAPFRNQAKAIAWDYLKHFSRAIPGLKINEQELYIELPNQARIRIFGADNPDALRGHYFDGVIFDEVAQIKSEVWGEIIQPALADREGWAVFIGTPKGINLFYDLYKHAHENDLWVPLLYPIHQTMKTADPPLSPEEVERLKGEMSNNAWRQEFLCDFSASADDVLIPVDLVTEAAGRVLTERDIAGLPVVVGVDVARFGSDSTVFFRRQGRQAFPPLVLQNMSNKDVSARLVSYYHEHKPAAIFVDAGQGQGIIDWTIDQIPGVVEVPFGGRALNEAKFLNRRSEMWYSLREWIMAGGAIPDDVRLCKELAAPTYSFNATGKIQLEPKEKIVERLKFSPDLADALALTFAQPVLLPGVINRPGKAVQKSSLYGRHQ
jgi:hypothetical protein